MRGTRAGRPIEILLVEDNPGDVRLVQEALSEGKLMNRMSVVTDGVSALRFLRQEGRHEEAPRPDLVLLDLNLPGKDGHEVLADMKEDADLRSIPVVVLTGSKEEHDILRAYDCHVNCYVTKPVGLGEFMNIVRTVEHFWLSIVELPSH